MIHRMAAPDSRVSRLPGKRYIPHVHTHVPRRSSSGKVGTRLCTETDRWRGWVGCLSGKVEEKRGGRGGREGALTSADDLSHPSRRSPELEAPKASGGGRSGSRPCCPARACSPGGPNVPSGTDGDNAVRCSPARPPRRESAKVRRSANHARALNRLPLCAMPSSRWNSSQQRRQRQHVASSGHGEGGDGPNLWEGDAYGETAWKRAVSRLAAHLPS